MKKIQNRSIRCADAERTIARGVRQSKSIGHALRCGGSPTVVAGLLTEPRPATEGLHVSVWSLPPLRVEEQRDLRSQDAGSG
ncbi:MAG: hypothetical protein KDB01_21890, partial [Planctomycetaceae bacterium]|nr:hypothetical protein [Planctomycetaceae bacterium]